MPCGWQAQDVAAKPRLIEKGLRAELSAPKRPAPRAKGVEHPFPGDQLASFGFTKVRYKGALGQKLLPGCIRCLPG